MTAVHAEQHDAAAGALARLDAVTRLLRRECPWDREQDERSIVPHTVEEAYELADAAQAGDDAKLADELGDVLFQVFFLSLLLEERGAGDLAAVADGCREKLIRRHPHVFSDTDAATAADVRRNWDEIKAGEQGRRPGPFGELPQTLPGPLYARKLMRRARAAGLADEPSTGAALTAARASAAALDASADREQRFAAAGRLLLAAVTAADALGVDPELALRSAADRIKGGQ